VGERDPEIREYLRKFEIFLCGPSGDARAGRLPFTPSQLIGEFLAGFRLYPK